MSVIVLPIGYDNFVPINKVAMILQVDSRPVRSMISNARDREKLIDATHGKKTKAVIVTSDGYVVLSAVKPKTLADRFSKLTNEESDL